MKEVEKEQNQFMFPLCLDSELKKFSGFIFMIELFGAVLEICCW